MRSCSKNEQCLEVQIQKLKAAGCDEIFMEKASGAKDDRKELNVCQISCAKGHCMCSPSGSSRPAHDEAVELINGFKDNGIEFVSLDNNIDTTTPLGMLLFNMCAAFSEMERN